MHEILTVVVSATVGKLITLAPQEIVHVEDLVSARSAHPMRPYVALRPSGIALTGIGMIFPCQIKILLGLFLKSLGL